MQWLWQLQQRNDHDNEMTVAMQWPQQHNNHNNAMTMKWPWQCNNHNNAMTTAMQWPRQCNDCNNQKTTRTNNCKTARANQQHQTATNINQPQHPQTTTAIINDLRTNNQSKQTINQWQATKRQQHAKLKGIKKASQTRWQERKDFIMWDQKLNNQPVATAIIPASKNKQGMARATICIAAALAAKWVMVLVEPKMFKTTI